MQEKSEDCRKNATKMQNKPDDIRNNGHREDEKNCYEK